jgi:hypothetical protein
VGGLLEMTTQWESFLSDFTDPARQGLSPAALQAQVRCQPARCAL